MRLHGGADGDPHEALPAEAGAGAGPGGGGAGPSSDYVRTGISRIREARGLGPWALCADDAGGPPLALLRRPPRLLPPPQEVRKARRDGKHFVTAMNLFASSGVGWAASLAVDHDRMAVGTKEGSIELLEFSG